MSSTPSIDASNTAPELRLTEPDAPPSSSSPESPIRALVCLPSMDSEALDASLAVIATAFPAQDVQVASPMRPYEQDDTHGLQMVPYTSERSQSGWVLAASDYTAAAGAAGSDNSRTILLLGGNTAILRPDLLRKLAVSAQASNADLVLPRFTIGPSDGLVNSAILYPLTRALFAADIRFPLPTDAAVSLRMLQRLASIGQRQAALGQGFSLIWPVAEAAIAGFSVRQVEASVGPPSLTQQDDFNDLFNNVAGSLFSDIEAKAAFWQRARSLTAPAPASPLPAMPSVELTADIQPMIESFHLAQANLQEIWALVLPPQSRLALKKLSFEPAAEFALAPDLWARVVYDFVLAFHLRTLNRGHLLGALIPLYMAWVASHLHASANDSSRAALHAEDTAAAFDAEKSYLVSRWRWPDRFNP